MVEIVTYTPAELGVLYHSATVDSSVPSLVSRWPGNEATPYQAGMGVVYHAATAI